jgi:hypothetical protein
MSGFRVTVGKFWFRRLETAAWIAILWFFELLSSYLAVKSSSETAENISFYFPINIHDNEQNSRKVKLQRNIYMASDSAPVPTHLLPLNLVYCGSARRYTNNAAFWKIIDHLTGFN